jgi:NAD(P)-dependent dehydrogenase (short-subunit alcohol dehydrogenase family)
MPNKIEIRGRVALVTGANRGIGRAIVDELLARGAAKVYAAARRPEALAPLAAQDARVIVLPLDVTSDAQIRDAVAAAGDVDLLVNNAGIAGHSFAEFGDPFWVEAGRQEFEVNVLGTLRVSQAVAPVLARNGGGVIVNLASISGLVNFPVFLTYSASKAAAHSINQGTRTMLAGQGTTVIGVYPGPVDTEMAEKLPWGKVSPAEVASAIVDGVERGEEEIFPDPTSAQLGGVHASSPKQLERQVAAMAAG